MGNNPSVPASAEAKLLHAGHEAFASMAKIDEVNMFFVAQPGTDVAEFAELFAKRGALTLADTATDYASTATVLASVAGATVASRWSQPTAAVEWLLARQSSHTLLFLPGAAETPGARATRVYTRSPVEDLHIALPVLLSNRVDNTMMTLLQGAAEAAWHTLMARCHYACSIWIYLRLADDYWARLCETHQRTGGTSATQIAQWNEWRRATDAFFYHNNFVKRHHTLVITVHNDVLATNAVVADAAVGISRHIRYAHDAGAWGSGTPIDTLHAFIASGDYQRERHIVAVQAVTLRAPPPPPAPRPAPVETRLDVAPGSPFAQLPATRPFGRARISDFDSQS